MRPELLSSFFCTLLLTILMGGTTLAAENNYRDPVTGMEFIFLRGGNFEMGDLTRSFNIKELPVHTVTLSDFYIGKFEVTFSQYDKFCEVTGRDKPDDAGWGRDDSPVINVSWREAVDFTLWLSKVSGQKFRLPSEAEWEYAARAGTETIYWWGDDISCEQANYRDCVSGRPGRTFPVGQFPPNPWGLYDTAGNVYEWTFDNETRSYEKAPTDGKARLDDSYQYKIMRGGAWNSFERELRSSFRDAHRITKRNDTMGFRLVLEAPLAIKPAPAVKPKAK